MFILIQNIITNCFKSVDGKLERGITVKSLSRSVSQLGLFLCLFLAVIVSWADGMPSPDEVTLDVIQKTGTPSTFTAEVEIPEGPGIQQFSRPQIAAAPDILLPTVGDLPRPRTVPVERPTVVRDPEPAPCPYRAPRRTARIR